MDDIRYWVVHHVGSGTEPDPHPTDTANYHINEHGWPGIAYHWVIRRDGTLYSTMDMQIMSYHVASRNRECLGILVNGNFLGRVPTGAQIVMLRRLLAWLDAQYPGRQVVAHQEVALPGYETSCCGDTWSSWRSQVLP